MNIIKEIIEVTARHHGLNANVVGDDGMLIVSRAGYWPVSIPMNSLLGYPGTNEVIIDRLEKKLVQSGIIKK